MEKIPHRAALPWGSDAVAAWAASFPAAAACPWGWAFAAAATAASAAARDRVRSRPMVFPFHNDNAR